MTLSIDPARIALFLDFDGTLVDIAPRPEAIRVPFGLPDLLLRLLNRFDGALALVSGRSVAEIDAFLAPARLPACGLHGLDWRPDPAAPSTRPPPPAGIEAIRRALAAEGLADRGLRIEDKGQAIALHYREAPEREAAVLALARRILADHPDLCLLRGKMVAELKPGGASKALAVDRFLAEPAFVGRVPVFIGDDVTDEDGMRAAAARGGFGVKVGPGESGAVLRLAGVPAVHALLEVLATGMRSPPVCLD